MSVPVGERMISSTEFIYTASESYKLALRVCLTIPKRYTYLIGMPLLEKTRQLCEYTCRANCIFPIKYYGDFINRRKFLYDAKGLCISLICDISNLVWLKQSTRNGENPPLAAIRNSDLLSWSKLLSKENDLIERVIRSDERKYKSLQTQAQLESGEAVLASA